MLSHCKINIVQEFIFEQIKVAFKVCDINILISNLSNFSFVLKTVKSSITQNCDYLNKELRTNYIHLRVLVRNIYNAGVVIIIIFFEHGNKNRVLAFFFVTVFVELLKKVFIFFLCCSCVCLVFHFKHDGNEFNFIFAVAAKVAENKVAFTAA